MSQHVGIIGFGAIAQDLVGLLIDDDAARPLSVLVRPGREAEARKTLGPCGLPEAARITGDPEAFVAGAPDVVAECAGHEAVAAYGARILGAGIDLVAASVGALADAAQLDALKAAARRGGAQLVIPTGAIGGIDALSAARLSGLSSVRYTGRKPPQAWAGTPAEAALDLGALKAPATFFEGSAREAAQAYPRNANVAATLALAGLGMEATEVRLVADPTLAENVHEFHLVSAALDATIRLVGKPSPRNPKTSQTTVLSIARAILNREAAMVI